MSDIEHKRDFVMNLYSGPNWRKKVKKMPDAQVIAIYLREYDKSKKEAPKENENDEIPF